jgi:hypothetical protein
MSKVVSAVKSIFTPTAAAPTVVTRAPDRMPAAPSARQMQQHSRKQLADKKKKREGRSDTRLSQGQSNTMYGNNNLGGTA